jgi:AcrR family transcriptional regulator
MFAQDAGYPVVRSARPRDGRVARRDQTKARLVIATVELLAAQGYAETSIEEIAERAGVSKGSVFYNFGAKEELFEGAVRYSADLLTDRMMHAKGGATGGQALERILAALFRLSDQYRAATQALASELLRTGRPWAAAMPAVRRQLLSPLVGSLTEYIDELTVAGEITVPVPYAHVETLAASLWGSITFVALSDPHPAPVEARRHVFQTLLVSLAAYRGLDSAAVAFGPTAPAKTLRPTGSLG